MDSEEIVFEVLNDPEFSVDGRFNLITGQYMTKTPSYVLLILDTVLIFPCVIDN